MTARRQGHVSRHVLPMEDCHFSFPKMPETTRLQPYGQNSISRSIKTTSSFQAARCLLGKKLSWPKPRCHGSTALTYCSLGASRGATFHTDKNHCGLGYWREDAALQREDAHSRFYRYHVDMPSWWMGEITCGYSLFLNGGPCHRSAASC
jgi:hypothetical protein